MRYKKYALITIRSVAAVAKMLLIQIGFLRETDLLLI